MSKQPSCEERIDEKYKSFYEDLILIFNEDGSLNDEGLQQYWEDDLGMDEGSDPEMFDVMEAMASCGAWKTDGDDPDRYADYIIH